MGRAELVEGKMSTRDPSDLWSRLDGEAELLQDLGSDMEFDPDSRGPYTHLVTDRCGVVECFPARRNTRSSCSVFSPQQQVVNAVPSTETGTYTSIRPGSHVRGHVISLGDEPF
ncbi:Dual adapter for phosphotyrosine and 3-phosphotyrosine and 3-phosphoinositide [Tupaia chinensis]|uniref:Dual adapter for phosphotyrosine and 3-phosphotyrosine and 3-phosphoinositide n=1 Tax=Tupaia chinensis TaxID=246437 RepID=L9KKR9_TUPCH|nr:Dual adapter for phosphotyrosine and 3-phosphotyrosine and 3-phosphoinositide [Tupaia chinensis]